MKTNYILVGLVALTSVMLVSCGEKSPVIDQANQRLENIDNTLDRLRPMDEAAAKDYDNLRKEVAAMATDLEQARNEFHSAQAELNELRPPAPPSVWDRVAFWKESGPPHQPPAE